MRIPSAVTMLLPLHRLALTLLLASAASASADLSPDVPLSEPQLPDRSAAFPAGTSFELYPAFATGDEGEFYTLSLGIDHRPADSPFSISPQLVLGAATNTDDDTVAVLGFDLMGRYHLTPPPTADAPLAFFVEAGAGVQYTGPTSLPRTGTHANFRLRAGLGGAYRLSPRHALLAGVNLFHVSNANLLEPNNGHDGPFFYLGLRLAF